MIIEDTGGQINPHIQIQNFIAVIVILNHRVETVHHTQDPPIIKINQLITLITHIQLTLDHNHFITIEMKIVHVDQSHVIDFAM